MDNKPKLSIIILTYNKAYELNLLLKSLVIQDCKKEEFEVVIVDDGSDFDLSKIVLKYEHMLYIRFFCREHTGNRAANRNFGASKSICERLLFIDSDMIPEKDVVRKFIERTEEDPKIVLLGCRNRITEYAPFFIDEETIEKHFEILQNYYSILDERVDYLEKENQIEDWWLVYSHSICLWKSLFFDAGGFEEEMGKNWGVEDIDLGYRLSSLGAKIKVEKDLRFYHLHHPERWKERIKQLEKNHQTMYEKYKNWKVELYTKDGCLSTERYILLYNTLKKVDFVIHKVKKKVLDLISGDTILFGIDDFFLINSEKVKISLTPSMNNSHHSKIINLLGIRKTFYKDKQFENAIVNEEYYKINEGLYLLILKEASRVAKNVLLLNKSGVLKEFNVSKIPKDNQMVLFFLRGTSNDLTSYYYYNLAIALHNIKFKVGISFFHRNKKEIPRDLLISLKYERNEILNTLINHELEILRDRIPTFMEPFISRFEGVSENRIFWIETSFYNQVKLLWTEIGQNYTHLFYMKSSERNLYEKMNFKLDFLPVGIDSKLINKFSQKKRRVPLF